MSLPLMLRRLAFLTLHLAVLAHLATRVLAGETPFLPPAVGTTELFVANRLSGLGLNGFDPLSYRLDVEPRPGEPEHELVWGGVVWRFANEANLKAFVRSPTIFAPRIGGYDADRIAKAVAVPGDPGIFAVVGDALYMFASMQARERFLADRTAAARAETSWRRLRPSLVQG